MSMNATGSKGFYMIIFGLLVRVSSTPMRYLMIFMYACML